MGKQDHRSSVGEDLVDGRQGSPDTGIVGDPERLIQGNIEIHTHQHPQAGEVERIDGFHGCEGKKTGFSIVRLVPRITFNRLLCPIR